MLSLFVCITRSSLSSKEEIKLFAVANLIFHVSDFLRLSKMSFKYYLIWLKYSLTDSALFLSLLLLYYISLLVQKLLTLTGL